MRGIRSSGQFTTTDLCAQAGHGLLPARRRGLYQGTGPSRLTKEPVGPSGPIVAIRTIASVSSVPVWVPRLAFRSVAVKPGSTELIRSSGNALAYWIVSTFSGRDVGRNDEFAVRRLGICAVRQRTKTAPDVDHHPR